MKEQTIMNRSVDNREHTSVALCIDNISKRYQNKTVVDHINLKLGTGVYGLLGANGAGKTTLMRMICGILRPSEGRSGWQGSQRPARLIVPCWAICLRISGIIPISRAGSFCSIWRH